MVDESESEAQFGETSGHLSVTEYTGVDRTSHLLDVNVLVVLVRIVASYVIAFAIE